MFRVRGSDYYREGPPDCTKWLRDLSTDAYYVRRTAQKHFTVRQGVARLQPLGLRDRRISPHVILRFRAYRVQDLGFTTLMLRQALQGLRKPRG